MAYDCDPISHQIAKAIDKKKKNYLYPAASFQ